ncbi:hypothetical protein Asppvi_002116 [Aspergillus pseudoviridinutans]|uniref:Ankyrin repeat-containing domain protein n=1 Tax=Aspergillus pseudoviridinutans TaxID=1517512 RepID=A0A9P3B326_9EURO|nr:uncharacterized protein Asppvi_002116 [Aspergillus pseudoviridinutans]GIJ83297.1 hypothetical protein Asppvi_002116 [Aspergillus pseudoviridinutans]
MAENLGVVGSAISILQLVEQTIQTINRVRALRAFMGTVSDDLEEFLDDIEIVQKILMTLTPEMLDALSVPLIERRLQRFQADLTVFAAVVQTERDRVANKRLAKFKLFLKKEKLQKQRDSLENIRHTLILLQQTYFSSKPTRDSNPRRPKKLQHTYACGTRKNRNFSFRTPLLFVDKFWNLNITEINSGWNFGIRSYNVIPDNSAIIHHCQSGNIEEIQRLFDNRLASPFDCDEDGWSLLHWAVGCGQLEVCKFLLQNGADPTVRDGIGQTALEFSTYYRWMADPQNLEDLDRTVNLYRLLLTDNEDVLLEKPESTFVGRVWFQGPPGALRLIQESLFVNYASLPIELRFRRAMSLEAWNFGSPGPEMLRVAMGGDSIDSTAYHLTDEDGTTLLCKVVALMAVDIAHSREDNISGWREILREALQAGADLCQISTQHGYSHTPLMMSFDFYAVHLGGIRRARYNFHQILQRWALELQAAGVDLAAYGAKESALWKSGAVDSSFKVFMWSLRKDPFYHNQSEEYGEWLEVHLFSLSYGPNPEDWHVWFDNPVDEVVGEFWEMMEREEEIMPGTWVE